MFSLFSGSTNALVLLVLYCLCCSISICNAQTQPCAVFFVSSTKQAGDFGNVRAADALCTRLFEMNGKMMYKNAKTQLGIAFNFTAWLSTRSNTVIDRIGPFTAGCVENVNNDMLSMSFDLFRRNALLRAPNINELGSRLNDKVYTGSTRNGSFIAGDGNACMNWSSRDSSSKAVYGESAEAAQWSNKDDSTDSCEKEYPIYCFGVPIVTASTSTSTTTTVAITTPAPTTAAVGTTTTVTTTTTTVTPTRTGSTVAARSTTLSQTQESQPVSNAVTTAAASSSSSSTSLSVLATVSSLDNNSLGSAGSDSVDTSDVAVVTSQSDAQPTSDSSDWWIYVIIVIVVLLLLGLIVAWVGWRRGRARDSAADPARALDEAGDNDKFSPAHAMTSEYASAASVLGGDQNANVSVYGKAPDIPDTDIIYDKAV